MLRTVVLGLLVVLCAAKSDVIDLTEKTFNKVLESEDLWLVEFFAPWCGHCKSLAPEWEKAATSLKGLVNVAKVDATVEQSLAAKYDIKGYPTIKVFMPGGKDVKKKPETYQGERTSRPIVDYAISKMGNHITSVTDKSLQAFLDKSKDLPHVLLVTDKTSTAALYKSLSNKLHKKMVFGEARKTQKEVVKKYAVTEFPSVFVINGDADPVQFEGKIEAEKLRAFLEQHAGGAADEASDADGEPQKQYRDSKSKNAYHAPTGKAAPKRPAAPSDVVALTGAAKGKGSFDAACLRHKSVCVIAVLPGEAEESEFCSTEPPAADAKKGGDPQQLAVFRTVAENFSKDGTMFFSWVDAAKQQPFVAAFGNPTVPGVVVYRPGKRTRYATLHGDFTVATISALLDRVVGGDVTYTPLAAEPTLTKQVGCHDDDDDDADEAELGGDE